MGRSITLNHRAWHILFFLPLPLVLASAGCGGKSKPDCTIALALSVAPQSATADHAAAPPGNKVSFVGADSVVPGCIPTPGPLRLDLKWSVSDTVNTSIGNTPNVDYGVATCINATPAPVTVTATGTNRLGSTITGTATLACK
ncbi:MAG TPA: hypothetical protein VFR84_14830 [Candidatus Angelobacter sp.]|nr:hypothetical protein [Candidatus Angelobacter sp.]